MTKEPDKDLVERAEKIKNELFFKTDVASLPDIVDKIARFAQEVRDKTRDIIFGSKAWSEHRNLQIHHEGLCYELQEAKENLEKERKQHELTKAINKINKLTGDRMFEELEKERKLADELREAILSKLSDLSFRIVALSILAPNKVSKKDMKWAKEILESHRKARQK